MDVAAALLQLRPGAIWSMPNGCTDVSRITWHDKTEPVSQAELDAKLAEPQPARVPLTLEQKLDRLGLSPDELRSALAAPAPEPAAAASSASANGAGANGADTSGAGTSGGTGGTVPNLNTMTIDQMRAWAHDNNINVTAMAGSSDAKAWAAFLGKAAAG